MVQLLKSRQRLVCMYCLFYLYLDVDSRKSLRVVFITELSCLRPEINGKSQHHVTVKPINSLWRRYILYYKRINVQMYKKRLKNMFERERGHYPANRACLRLLMIMGKTGLLPAFQTQNTRLKTSSAETFYFSFKPDKGSHVWQ